MLLFKIGPKFWDAVQRCNLIKKFQREYQEDFCKADFCKPSCRLCRAYIQCVGFIWQKVSVTGANSTCFVIQAWIWLLLLDVWSIYLLIFETYSEPFQTSQMKHFGKNVNGIQPLTIFSQDVSGLKDMSEFFFIEENPCYLQIPSC